MEYSPSTKRELDYDEEKDSKELKSKTIELGAFFDLSEVHVSFFTIDGKHFRGCF
jgi:hypothetical protein